MFFSHLKPPFFRPTPPGCRTFRTRRSAPLLSAGNDVTVAFGAEAGQLELNVMEPVIIYKLFSGWIWIWEKDGYGSKLPTPKMDGFPTKHDHFWGSLVPYFLILSQSQMGILKDDQRKISWVRWLGWFIISWFRCFFFMWVSSLGHSHQHNMDIER